MIVKTSFFQRTFNITVVLLTYGLFFFLLCLCFRFTQDLLGNAQSTYLSELFATISSWLSQGEYYKNHSYSNVINRSTINHN